MLIHIRNSQHVSLVDRQPPLRSRYCCCWLGIGIRHEALHTHLRNDMGRILMCMGNATRLINLFIYYWIDVVISVQFY